MSGHESTYVPKTGIEKWLDTRLPIVRFGADYLALPTPKNLNYWYTFGAILSLCLVVQIASGIFTGTLDWSMLGAGVLVGLAVIAADWALRKSERGSLPPLAVGLGIYLPPTIGVTLTIGAVLGYVIQRAIKSYGERNGKDWTKAAEERGLLLASGLIVGESLMGLLLAVVIGFSGSNSPLALVGEGFTAAPWLGLVFFVALIGIFYRRVLAK